MRQTTQNHSYVFVFSLIVGLGLGSTTAAEDQKINDGWAQHTDGQSGLVIHTKELIVYPRAEPSPALKHRLLIDDFDAVPGNAAIHFLKASGFILQDRAREEHANFINDSYAKSKQEGTDVDTFPPWSWLATHPDKLPLTDVKAYLQPLAFQVAILREGARRQEFDLDRNLRHMVDPIGYPLPEIQGSRDLARAQSLRCRVAIAENRIADAIEISGQQLAMARHLGQDDFLVSNLVGMGFVITAWNDMLYLVQRAETPNLYWALATMPSPLVSIRHSMPAERHMLYHQLSALKEVSETPQSEGYWHDFIERFLPQLGAMGVDLEIPAYNEDPAASRAALLKHIEAGYSGAREFLLTHEHLPQKQVDAYPKTQVVFLGMVRYYAHWRDAFFKWMHLPFWQARLKVNSSELEESLRTATARYGWCARPTQAIVPGVFSARVAEARCEQSLALLRTVECLRMYAAGHNGELPSSLAELSVPAPIEPFTGQPVRYVLDDDHAIITGHDLPGMQYRLVVRVAKRSEK